jgi:hypothetical protein
LREQTWNFEGVDLEVFKERVELGVFKERVGLGLIKKIKKSVKMFFSTKIVFYICSQET